MDDLVCRRKLLMALGPLWPTLTTAQLRRVDEVFRRREVRVSRQDILAALVPGAPERRAEFEAALQRIG